MPDLELSGFTAFSSGLDIAAGDLMDWVDVSDTTLAPSGTNKRSTLAMGRIALGGFVETELDFGSTPTYSKRFTVTDASVTTACKIAVWPSGNTATGRVGNDFEWDVIQFSAKAGTGDFVVYATAQNGPVKGKRKVFYKISS